MRFDRIFKVIEDEAFDALVDGAEGLLTKIIDDTPYKSGTLRRSQIVTPNRSRKSVILSANTPYARPLHEGYGPFEIRPATKKALYWKGAKHPVKRIRHPGYKGNPWMKRTVDRNFVKLGRYVHRRVKDALKGRA